MSTHSQLRSQPKISGEGKTSKACPSGGGLEAKPPAADEYLRFFNKKRVIVLIFYKNIPLLNAKVLSTCNRNLNLGELVNP